MTTVANPSVPAQVAAPTASAVFRGKPFPIVCPEWCVTDHASINLICVEDLNHEGEPISLPVPQFSGPDVLVLRGRLAQWPFADRSAPYLALEATDDGEVAELPAGAALAFADQLDAHSARLRRMAATLQKEVA